jgi:hypothetical protein
VRGHVGHNARVEGVVARPFGRRAVRVLVAAGLGAAVLAWPLPAGATRVSLSGTMEGTITVSPGDTVRTGWDLSMPGAHPAATVTVSSAGAGVSVSCPDGQTQWVGMSLPNQAFTIAAGDNSWHPSPDSSNPAVWQGSTVAPKGLCNGSAGRSTQGAVLVANLTSTDTTDMVSIRFHYSDKSPGTWSAAKSFQPSSSGGPTATPVPTPPPVKPGAATPPRTLPPTPGHPSVATARGAAKASPVGSPTAQELTPATGGRATPADTGAPPRDLQQSVTALRRPLVDPGASTTPPTLLGLWSAAGVAVIAIAGRWRWRRRARLSGR